jgi:hypothetical protein
MTMTENAQAVEFKDALSFIEMALRNVDLPPMSTDDIRDVRNALREFLSTRLAASDASYRRLELAGWKLVPVEPTDEMVAAGRECASAAVYARMLAASPSSPAASGGEAHWPDIGPDPFQQPNEYRTVEKAHARLRQAYALQQPIVPNQTALVWRDDIGRVHMRLVQLEALFAERDAEKSAPPADVEEAVRAALDAEFMNEEMQPFTLGDILDREGLNSREQDNAVQVIARAFSALSPAGDERVREALRPFAEAANRAHPNHKTAFVYVADLQRAAAALASTEANGNG